MAVTFPSTGCTPSLFMGCLKYPYLVYYVSVWGSTYTSNLNRTFISQKRVIRVISRSAFDAHTDPLFKNLKILKFYDIYRFQTLKFMFLFKNGLLPNMFKEMFYFSNQVHSYNTRNSNSFHIFPCRTNIRQFGIRFQGPKLFNTLLVDIQNSENVSSFKTKLKALLLN